MPSFPKVSTSLEQGTPHSRLRLSGLLTVVFLTVLLPLAGASAGPVGDTTAHGGAKSGRPDSGGPGSGGASAGRTPAGKAGNAAADKTDDKPGADGGAHRQPAPAALLSGLGLGTSARCGPELSAPDGIEAQTCVLTQGRETWARTYYRNATGNPLSSVLTLMAPAGRTVEMHCAVGAQDEPGTCDTPRERTAGAAGDYSAVAEFAGAGDEGPLLLRSGSNAAEPSGR